MTAAGESDLVVLVNESGEMTGTASRSDVHHADTPLHLAFSCHLFDPAGRVLLTRRSLAKTAWPGVWSNSFCGHPRPGERLENAVHRRAREELGMRILQPELVLPGFRYAARDAGGVLENEICPVFIAFAHGEPAPDPAEVLEWTWLPDWLDLRSACMFAPFAFSPWLRQQEPLLTEALRGRNLAALAERAGKPARDT